MAEDDDHDEIMDTIKANAEALEDRLPSIIERFSCEERAEARHRKRMADPKYVAVLAKYDKELLK